MGIDRTTSQENTGDAIGDNDLFRGVQGPRNVKFFFYMVKAWIQHWISKSDVGLGNVPNVDTTNAGNLSSGTLNAARMPGFGSGDVSFAASGGAGTIANNAVTNAKAAQMAANTIKGNNTGSTANASDLTVAQAQALLSIFPAATKSNQQAATSNVVAVTPLHQQDHPSAAKAWCHYQGAGTPTIIASYNVSSVTRSSAGNYTFNWTTAFASASYSALCQGNDNGSGAGSFALLETLAAASLYIVTVNPSTLAQADAAHASVVAYGAQ